ncbi:hypothetical protein [Alteromonas oceanisediminis]|uniref:hypothetical protein n=1 Tax=Alteromonas oceanisediminis TaxID=2836180 RepID=UPI001BDA48E2|nr:hypothetical protein [Alteromonas oceanisediminis]MBT0587553.1 hypothetical protein [Alteromonas oceanisediminis]
MRRKLCKFGLVLSASVLMYGCELMQSQHVSTSEPERNQCVIADGSVQISEPECHAEYWFNLWETHTQQPWQQRKASMADLGTDVMGQLRRFILSQPMDTPYQDRLRAQSTFNQIKSKLAPEWANRLDAIAYKPSQQLLEYESAITILSEVNARQQGQIKEQAQLLLENEEKVNQLLNVEASILEKNAER